MSRWQSRHVLITGGLGFVGSNLAHHLTEKGAEVTLLDSRLPHLGSNMANVAGIRDDVTITESDVRDETALTDVTENVDVVYHCAAQNDRSFARSNPRTDTDINCTGTLNVLEAAKAADPDPRIVYTSSLAVYGRAEQLPVDESTPARPIDIYGANKRAAEHYTRIYHLLEDVPTVVCRLANVYGPRAAADKGYGVQAIFVAAAVRDETLTVFEPGTVLRDFVFIADVVDALERAGRDSQAIGEEYVLGSGTGTPLKALAEEIVEIADSGEVELVPWPDDWKTLRRGDIYTDPSKLQRDLNWTPTVDLETGLSDTIEFYREHASDYL